MTKPLQQLSLSQQLALTAAAMCLLVSLALVALGTISSRHTQQLQQDSFGFALANQIAHRVGSNLETGDLLGVAAYLQQFVETTAADEVAVYDVEGKLLGRAGAAGEDSSKAYRADITIEQDIAGEIAITLASDGAKVAQQQLLLSLAGLALLLSAVVFQAALFLGQRLSTRMERMASTISLEDAIDDNPPVNALRLLEQRIEQLPMDLLRTRSSGDPRDENYRSTAVLYMHLTSLVGYVDTLDEDSLHRYTRRVHRVIFAAAGFYAGELQVARQFGLALYFSGDNNSGSAAFRAASCAWLIQATCSEVEKQMPFSMSMAMAISHSELGIGDGSDIYPGLYMQHTIDELHALCASKPPKVLLSPAVCRDVDVDGRVVQNATELKDYGMLESFAEPYNDLLERQLRLILRKLSAERS